MQDYSTRTPYFPENLDDYAPWVAKHGLRAPYGKCQCGCGQTTTLAGFNRAGAGQHKGQPQRYILRHHYERKVNGQEGEKSRPDLPADGRVMFIALGNDKVAVVDAVDYEWLNQWKWHATKKPDKDVCYAVRNIRLPNNKWQVVSMHRLILGITDSRIQGDHIDGDGLNNTRGNLRIATNQQNCFNQGKKSNNKSGYKGISWRKETQKWVAQIGFQRRRIHIGVYETAEEAARAYDKVARELQGEFARVNFQD